MDLFAAIKGRRSCRSYLPDPINEETIEKILEAAVWAPSPLNSQPWEFMVITSQGMKEKIFSEADRCRKWALEKSGWKWLGPYQLDFLKSAPVLIAVVGDPKKTGLDMFMEEGYGGYQAACAAAIQNMHLSAHSFGLGTLWFTLFERKAMREILNILPEKTPLAHVCLGKPSCPPSPVPRKEVKEKTSYIR